MAGDSGAPTAFGAWFTPEVMAERFRPAPDPDGDDPPRQRPLQRDPLVRLLHDGALTRLEVNAGWEIGRVFRAVVTGLCPGTVAVYGERLRGTAGGDLPAHLRLAYTNRYAPWRDWAGREHASRRQRRASLADLTILACVDALGPEQVAQRLGIHRRTASMRLAWSLHRYCVMAGWVAEK